MTAADLIRREGMADAAVLLVAKRVVPTMSLNEWGRHLGLTELDLQHAVARIKGRAAEAKKAQTPPRTRLSNTASQAERDRIVATLSAMGGVVTDPTGRASSVLRMRTGTAADVFRFSTWLKQLEDDGRITRDVRGKRTFSIALKAA